MRLNRFSRAASFLAAPLLLLIAMDASAAIDSVGLMDEVLRKFKDNASSWANLFESAATRLFWTLAIISMVWTFGMMALRKADIGEFFAEFVRFTIFTGFFWWALDNGPAFAASIIDSLKQLGGDASALGGFADNFSPSSIVDIGFICLGRAFDSMSGWSPIDSFVGVVLALGVLVLMTLIAVNMLLLLVSAWILAYAGIFFLGFGGSKWTSDMAINYYKTVLGIAAQIMAMLLIVGIGKNIIFEYYDNMEEGVQFMEMAVILVVAVVLFVLTNKVPQLISGIITGASVGGAGIGTFGAGAAVGAAGMAAAALATGGAAMAAGAANISGGTQALMAAFKSAQGNVAAGTDISSSLAGAFSGGGGDGGGGGGMSASSESATPLAAAMGDGASSASPSFASSSAGSSTSQSSEQSASSSSASSSSSSSESGGGGQSTAQTSSSQDGGQAGSPSSSKLATAGRIAADMGANLASGMGRMAANKAAEISGAAKARIADTAGGRLAQEISNPGAQSQERRDNQDIAAAEAIRSQQERTEKAEEAREFLSGQSAPSFEGDSIAGASSDFNPADEIAAFRDKKS
ncbi:conjugal transfer protein TrbL [Xanthomonas euvesicatoria]|uniref:P-type conjugative transfer protein TrbL n=1 Tax=Xanthomonas euvesicatoria TaxID=456327 RepID=UPI00062D396E|nr:P-type conjugative transfer protein TrbL [Xanthomonas euvesicatoria]EJU9618006.1 P-type conjugative transfer protein TrbL [Pseudomonas aeruginosa]KLB54900.1 conjugal transfer protein TrbL [Xanthomonas euvesicatoria]KLB72412.1 conjugal transfer protein TrbL [Xanthomonas euvesicatoria]KLB84220.1 conjugal transfer protein TrbL [Xanthomonas euvesicatoria]KLB85005.1 conjugal transfer protein TrbL [Xanthomonas euvesicatoria]